MFGKLGVFTLKLRKSGSSLAFSFGRAFPICAAKIGEDEHLLSFECLLGDLQDNNGIIIIEIVNKWCSLFEYVVKVGSETEFFYCCSSVVFKENQIVFFSVVHFCYSS